MYVLDTHVVSELRRKRKINSNVAAWAASVPVSAMYLSVTTVMEVEIGVLLKERKDRSQGKALRAWLEERLLPRFEGRILDYDLAVARRCARLHVPDPMAERDAIIAATALVHDMTVVTRNVADFAKCGVALHNPWD